VRSVEKSNHHDERRLGIPRDDAHSFWPRGNHKVHGVIQTLTFGHKFARWFCSSSGAICPAARDWANAGPFLRRRPRPAVGRWRRKQGAFMVMRLINSHWLAGGD